MKRAMKRPTMIASVCALALGLSANNVWAADIVLDVTGPNSTRYLGLINPSQPASLADEAGYINTLVPLSAGSHNVGSRDYTRTANYNPCLGCPTALGATALKNNAELSKGVPNPGFDAGNITVTGFSYLLAKYDGPNYGSEVWYVGGLTGTVSIPTALPAGKYGISHYSLFNPTSVADGGMTLMLLGGALIGLEGLRRRFRV